MPVPAPDDTPKLTRADVNRMVAGAADEALSRTLDWAHDYFRAHFLAMAKARGLLVFDDVPAGWAEDGYGHSPEIPFESGRYRPVLTIAAGELVKALAGDRAKRGVGCRLPGLVLIDPRRPGDPHRVCGRAVRLVPAGRGVP
jgi:hypothetical protein